MFIIISVRADRPPGAAIDGARGDRAHQDARERAVVRADGRHFKAGDPDTPVTGVAVTMMATFDVIQRAAAAGQNLVITHEPTFYGHQDEVTALERSRMPSTRPRSTSSPPHHMVVWRFHDFWHRRTPDGILTGMVKALGWESYQKPDAPEIFSHARNDAPGAWRRTSVRSSTRARCGSWATRR